MTWAEAQASLQLEAELRVGAAMRAKRDALQSAVDGINGGVDAAMREAMG